MRSMTTQLMVVGYWVYRKIIGKCMFPLQKNIRLPYFLCLVFLSLNNSFEFDFPLEKSRQRNERTIYGNFPFHAVKYFNS